VSSDNFDGVLRALLDRRPFFVFTIELRDKRRFEIDHLDAIIIADGIAVFDSPGSVLMYFDHESVNCIIDAPASDVPNGSHQ
jgi:hypothetical protein